MITDHYAALGLTSHAGHSAIRAAYLALMRLYHPDRNQSADAAVRVREVTAAYEVLRHADSRMDYDMARAYARAELAAQTSRGPGLKQPAIALLAVAGTSLLLLLYSNPFAPEIQERIEREVTARYQPSALQKNSDPATLCSSAANSKLLKQELFARAASLRGSDVSVYRQFAAYSVLRMKDANLVRASDNGPMIYCNASVGIDLPPGVAVPGGRRNFSGDIGYSLKPSNGGRDLVALFHAGTLAKELATLVSVKATTDTAISTAEVNGRVPAEVVPPPALVMTVPIPAARVEQPRRVAPTATASPSARVAPSRAVPTQPQKAKSICRPKGGGAASSCNTPAVVGLDRDLGMLFRQSMQRAGPAKQQTLYRDHYRFIARLNRCPSEVCARGEYLGRMREVSKTMSARREAR